MILFHSPKRMGAAMVGAFLSISFASAQTPVKEKPLTQVIADLAREAHIQYTVDPAVQGDALVSTYGAASHLDPRSLLDLVLRVNGAVLVKDGSAYRIVLQSQAPQELETTKASAPAGGSVFGADMGGSFRGCLPSDKSPDGTVVSGLKKIMTQTPFGLSCHWEPAK